MGSILKERVVETGSNPRPYYPEKPPRKREVMFQQ